MVELLTKKLEQLVDLIFEPFFEWFKRAGWFARCLLIFVVIAALLAIFKPQWVAEKWAVVERIGRVLMTDAGSLPVKQSIVEELDGAIRRLESSIRADYSKLRAGETDAMTAWSAAQAAAAVRVLDSNDSSAAAKIAEHIRNQRLEPCFCWAELPDGDQSRAWNFISGWVLFALALHDIPAEPEEVAFLLNQQSVTGAWPSLPTELERYHSTYATAWAIIGLSAQIESGFLDVQAAEMSNSAIARAANWLMSKRSRDIRWSPYPNLANSSISLSISGVALHALHQSSRIDLAS